jgi:WD40 repeat protein
MNEDRVTTMRKLGLFALIAFLPLRSFSATEYVIINNGNYISNSAILYKLNTRTGKLAKTAVLHTGGQGVFGAEADLSQIEQAATADAVCIFVFDDGSSDIAAFSKASSYERVGKYFNSKLIAGSYGGTVALTPDGQFLYSSYSQTGYIGAWKVNPDCTLTFIASFFDNYALGPIKVTPNGKYLVNSSAQGWAALWTIDGTTGGLTSLNTVGFETGACARTKRCFPFGLDITKDSKFVVFASYASNITRQNIIPVALTARITSSGLTNPRIWVLKNPSDLRVNYFPFFSAAGYAGSGYLYFGVESAGPGYSPGVLTTHFTESPMTFTVTNATVVDPQVGNIAVTGNVMVVAQPPNQIGVFRIQKDGSLKLLTSKTIDEQGEGMFSLSIFPNTR